MRSFIVLAALGAALASREASAQRCPPAPQDFRPRINVYAGDTLLARPELVLAIHLQHQHCTTSRAPAAPVAPSSLRATIIDGPLAGRALSITRRGQRFALAIPTTGTHTIRVESAAFASLAPATVRVHVMDPRRARPVRLALGRSPLDGVAPTQARADASLLELAHASGARRILVGAAFERGRTTPEIALEEGSYTVTSTAGTVARSARISVRAGREAIPVEFEGASARIELDLLPDYRQQYSLLVTRPDGSRERRPIEFPGATLGHDLAPGALTVSLESAPLQRGDAAPEWRVHHREVLQIQRQTAHTFSWSMPSILAGLGSARRPWRALGSLSGVQTTVPTGDVMGSPRAFASIADALLILTDRIAERRGSAWTALSMPTGWTVPNATASVAALSSDTYAWVAQSLVVGYRTPAGVTAEPLPIATPIARSTCSAEGIAAPGPDALVVVGRCQTTDGATSGFIATRDALRWTMRPERFAPLWSAAPLADGVIVVGNGGFVATLQGHALATRSIGDLSLRRVRVGRTRIVMDELARGLIEYDPRTGRYAQLPAVHEPRFGVALTEFCFVGDSLVILSKRRPRESRSHVFVDDGTSPREVSTRATHALGLACTSAEAWLLDEAADGTHSIVRVPVGPGDARP